jgi:hypothetical protein
MLIVSISVSNSKGIVLWLVLTATLPSIHARHKARLQSRGGRVMIF